MASSLSYAQLPLAAPHQSALPRDFYPDSAIGAGRAVRSPRRKSVSYISAIGQWFVTACLLFATIHIVHAGWVHASELVSLLSQQGQLDSYHQQLQDTHEQLKSNLKYYASPKGQETLIRNQLNLVGQHEILVRFQ